MGYGCKKSRYVSESEENPETDSPIMSTNFQAKFQKIKNPGNRIIVIFITHAEGSKYSHWEKSK